MRFIRHMAESIIVSMSLLVFAPPAQAIDAPHNDTNSVGCNSCHSHWIDAPGSHIDETTMNLLCMSCHDGSQALKKVNHTGKETGSDGMIDPTHYYTNNGIQQNWTLQCIDCHDPHYQKQAILYKTDISADGAYLVTNTIAVDGLQDNVGGDGLIETIVSNGSPGWLVDEFAGYSLVIGDSRLKIYRIKSNTADSIEVYTSPTAGIRVGTRYAQEGSTFRIVYGKMIRGQMVAPRPIKNGISSYVFNASTYRDVKYFQDSGSHSAASRENDDKAICIVCHTRTSVMNIGRLWYGTAFDGVVDNSHLDRVSASTSCWDDASSCHKPPAQGFDADCSGCHGWPPESASSLINTIATGRTTAGAHVGHKAKGISDCNLCHAGGGQSSENPDDEHSVDSSLTMGFTTGLNQGTYTASALNAPYLFINGSNVTINTTGGPGTCDNIYCHSDGRGSFGVFYSVDWDGPSRTCKSCHGADTSGGFFTSFAGEPNYANGGIEVFNSNSHQRHVNAAADCTKCHDDTTNDGVSTIINGAHLSGSRDVAFDVFYDANAGSKYDNYDPGTKTCSNITCHGPGTPQWGGASLGCANCHLRADASGGDADNFDKDGTPARISSEEWTGYGHGNDALTTLITKAGSGDPCLWCHDRTEASHDSTGSNPFRLKITGNDSCWTCHDSDNTAGYDAGEGFESLDRNNIIKVDKYHQMPAHSQSGNTGGQFCWDCHDPHGDNTNIKMIQKRPARTSDADGRPTSTPGTDVVFTDNTTPTGAGGFAMPSGNFEQGLCNACHTASASGPKMEHYTSTSSDGVHNASIVCTTCHKHSSDSVNDGSAFKGRGCNGCHGYPPEKGDGFASKTEEKEGKGSLNSAHDKHVNYLTNRYGLAPLDPNNDQFGTGTPAIACGTCHTNSPANHTTGGGGTRSINFGDGSTTYQFTAGGPQYNGVVNTSSDVNFKSCSNVSCHYKETPGWTDPLDAGD